MTVGRSLAVVAAAVALAPAAHASPETSDGGTPTHDVQPQRASIGPESAALRFGPTARVGWLPDQALRLDYQGSRMYCELAGQRYTLGGLAEYRFASFALGGRLSGSYEKWTAASSSCDYGYGLKAPELSGFSAQLDAVFHWHPGVPFVGLGPLLGVSSISGRAGRGLSEADASQRGPFWGALAELGVAVGPRRQLVLSATTLVRFRFAKIDDLPLEVGVAAAYLFD